jgi:5-formyltetrahydrofolate cyclo-ligase
MTDPNPGKSQLRRELRHARASVPEHTRRSAGPRVTRLALHARLLGRGRRIAFYMPAKGELDILPLLNRALWMRVSSYLPVVPERGKKRLWFSRLGDGPHWRLNRYDIPEYHNHRGRVRARDLDTLFVPLLGFDMRGYRLGMGGGYYDASLAHLTLRHHWRRPRLVGVAFEAQKLAEIPSDPWDIPLEFVITEARIYRFRHPAPSPQ